MPNLWLHSQTQSVHWPVLNYTAGWEGQLRVWATCLESLSSRAQPGSQTRDFVIASPVVNALRHYITIQVCDQLPTSADNATLLACSCCSAPAVRKSIEIPCLLGPQQQTRRVLLQRSTDGTNGRTDKQTYTVSLHRLCRILYEQSQPRKLTESCPSSKSDSQRDQHECRKNTAKRRGIRAAKPSHQHQCADDDPAMLTGVILV